MEKKQRQRTQKEKVETRPKYLQLNTQTAEIENTYIENERNKWYEKLPQTKIEHIKRRRKFNNKSQYN